jgi:anaerobic magnesium-protoporphyrin IX monomethyl ester cyclase
MKKVLFIRSPRYYVSSVLPGQQNFQLPLGMCSVASALKESLSDIEVEVIDCPAVGIGWKTLTKILEEKRPDIIAAGEPQCLYYHETIKLFDLVKSIHPDTITIAGGPFFSSVADFVFRHFKSVDIIVKGEAEVTLTEVVRALIKKDKLDLVNGIAFQDREGVCHTPARPLIENLDHLPLPAYDLFPMEKYTTFASHFNSQQLPSVVIETSRGCAYSCDFCMLWYFWGKNDHGQMRPCLRRKSVKRVMEEIEICYEKFGRRNFIFTDPTFNLSQSWTLQFCHELKKKKYDDISWFVYLRPDLSVLDEENGILEEMVESGLTRAFLGVERQPGSPLGYFGKGDYAGKAVSIFHNRYPSVIIILSFLAPMPGDSYEDILDQSRTALHLDPHYVFMSFPYPFPGTELFQQYLKTGELIEEDLLQTDYGAHNLIRSHLAKIYPKINTFPFCVMLSINPIMLHFFLSRSKDKNGFMRSLSKLTYRNKFLFFCSALVFLLCLWFFFLLSKLSKTFTNKMCRVLKVSTYNIRFKNDWYYGKPDWYDT